MSPRDVRSFAPVAAWVHVAGAREETDLLIERDVRVLCARMEDPVEDALRKITANRRRAVLVVDDAGVLVGVLTDGDFRRWLLDNGDAPLSTPTGVVANRQCVSARTGTPVGEVEALFSSAVTLVPLVDERHRVVGVAVPWEPTLRIGERWIGTGEPTFIVAEIGNNHNGQVEVAKVLVDLAVSAGADCAKFQMRDLGSLYRNAGRTGDHREDLGPQYTLDLLERFSLGPEALLDVFDYCTAQGILPLCTAWDVISARMLDDYGIPAIKVASADLTNHELLSVLGDLARPVIMSTGMSQEDEIQESIGVLRQGGASFALLHCNSTYPTPYRDVQLRYMDRLAELGNCAVGYSGHERGFHVAIAAVARGASIIEKHITLDRTWEGSDHKVSLLPDELGSMVRQIRELEEALGGSGPRRMSQGEVMNRVNLAKSLVASRSIVAGEEITREKVAIRSPGRGVQPNRLPQLLGRRARRDVEVGDFFFPGDLQDEGVLPRDYKFRRPWGLPVRYHDFQVLLALSNPDFLEFHMSYRDLDLRVDSLVPEPLPVGLVVHSPELFPGDHLLDLACDDPAYRDRSLRELQRVVDVTRDLAQRFRVVGDVLLITNVGGFSSAVPFPASARPRLYERVAACLDRLDDEGVEIVPQTLPPFPWLLGGQMVHNLFVEPDGARMFAEEHGRRLCLDVSHTKLACNHLRSSFSEAVEMLAPLSAHLHVVDAAGIDDEGLQIGEGEVDFSVLAEQLDRLAPHASFIPEIWQGHQNGGEGFWIALDRLERYL